MVSESLPTVAGICFCAPTVLAQIPDPKIHDSKLPLGPVSAQGFAMPA